jgi:hypothetical protein
VPEHVEVAREIYDEAFNYFSSTPPPYGYKILNSSPLLRPPVLFLSYQPAGKEREDYETSWPDVCQHATHHHWWDLPKAMQRIFHPDLLKQCCGVAAIFVRAPRIADYERDYSKQERIDHADFCIPCVERLVQAIKPQAIVAIGLASLRLFGPTEPGRRRGNGDPLVETGKVAGRDAISMLHLSGAWISVLNRGKITEDVFAYLRQQGVAVEMVDGRICASR